MTDQTLQRVDAQPLPSCSTSLSSSSSSGYWLWSVPHTQKHTKYTHSHTQHQSICSEAGLCLSTQAVSLWTNFMGMTDGKEPLVIYAIVCWGKAFARSASWSYFSCCVLSLSSVVAILWVVSTILIGRFGLDGLQFSDVYGLAGDL